MIRPCSEPGCPNPATHKSRCHQHQRQQQAGRNDESNKRIYNTRKWALTRLRHLSNHPLCAKCGRVATDVHHITDLADGGDPYYPDNLESLCHRCHSRQTRHNQLIQTCKKILTP